MNPTARPTPNPDQDATASVFSRSGPEGISAAITHGIGDQVLAKKATQMKSDATRKLAYAPVGAANFVVMAPRIAMQQVRATEPVKSTVA